MKKLVVYLADFQVWVHLSMTTDKPDFAIGYEQPEIKNKNLLDYLDIRVANGLSVPVPEKEIQPDKTWTLRNGDKVYSANPKVDVMRMALTRQIHHRAQPGLYLRLLSIPIPCIYF